MEAGERRALCIQASSDTMLMLWELKTTLHSAEYLSTSTSTPPQHEFFSQRTPLQQRKQHRSPRQQAAKEEDAEKRGKKEERGERVQCVEDGLLYERVHINVHMRVHWR